MCWGSCDKSLEKGVVLVHNGLGRGLLLWGYNEGLVKGVVLVQMVLERGMLLRGCLEKEVVVLVDGLEKRVSSASHGSGKGLSLDGLAMV